MKTVSFTDGKISHTVHTREETLNLVNRYWPVEPEVKATAYAKLTEVINEELNTMQRLNASNDEREEWTPGEYFAERDRIKTLWTTFENTICSVGAKMLSGVEYDRLIEYFEEVEPLASLSNAFAGKEE
ncbi:hypothetical protein [Enterococcus innesii]|nr:hypothetical protein [Enterococcus innesii]